MKQGRFEIRISTNLRARLHAIAKLQGMSDSEAARYAIRKWVEQNEASKSNG